ncbi:hypothetical protein TNCV_2713851 [Trichonephila clavipes]|nr:hypothetical protein TNCV_2713851 [Trichonephila clavipes]
MVQSYTQNERSILLKGKDRRHLNTAMSNKLSFQSIALEKSGAPPRVLNYNRSTQPFINYRRKAGEAIGVPSRSPNNAYSPLYISRNTAPQDRRPIVYYNNVLY